MRKKIVAVLMVLVFICCALPTVFAADVDTPTINPRWNNVFYVTAQLSRSGRAEAEVALYEAKSVTLDIELQEDTGIRWEETGDSSSGSDIGHCLVQDNFNLESGVDYRIKVTVNVYDDSDRIIETVTKYSSVVTG